MDAELRQYLEAMEGRLQNKIGASEERMVQLITDVKESLERQMTSGFSDINHRLDVQSTRLDRQASLIQVGSRWSTRMVTWSDRVDRDLEKKTQEISDLRRRVDRLEGGAKQ